MSIATIKSVRTKGQAVDLFLQGFFGNRVRQWNSLQDLLEDPFDKHVVIRQRRRGKGGRGYTFYDLNKTEVPDYVYLLRQIGIPEDSLYFNEAIIPQNVIFQGEIKRSTNGLYLLYSTYPHHMHVALAKRPEHAFGLRAKLLMERYVCEQGLECIWDLLERFDDHVVEFTTCSEVFGDLKWRTIIWECRGF